MSNELMRLTSAPKETPAAHSGYADEEDASEWDLPPEEMGYGARPDDAGPMQNQAAAHQAAQDAARARSLGDTTFASIREGDAGDLTQSRWDWGDLRTWLWFAAMFFGFLLLVALCYFLPEGRHASPPPGRYY